MQKLDKALRDYAVYSHAQMLPPVDWWRLRENICWLIAGGFAILLTIVGE